MRNCMFAAAGCAASIVVLIILAAVVLRTTFVKHRQTTINMEPTIARGERVIVRRAGTIRRGDLVTFNMPKGDGIAIGRVIALPGEEVELRGGFAVVNGTPLEEPYVLLQEGAEPQIPVLRDMPTVQVPADAYFLLGDNRDHANDSRFLGFVKRSDIPRKVVLIVSEGAGVRWP